MAKELECKFLVTHQGWRSGDVTIYRQGYLSLDKDRTVRVRVRQEIRRI